MKQKNPKTQHPVVEKIRKIISDKGITRAAAAELMGTSASQLSKMLSGEVNFSLWHLSNFASSIGLEIQDLFVYPDHYVPAKAEKVLAAPAEAILQIKLKGDKRNQVLRLVFGDQNLEILNKQ